MSERHDDDEENIVVNRVDDPVVTDPNAQTRPTLQCAGGRRSRVQCQQRDGTLEATTDRWVKLA